MRTFPIPLVGLVFVLAAGLILAGCQLPLPMFRAAPTATLTPEPTFTATTAASPTFTPSPAPTSTPTPLPATIRVRADVLNVRKAPSTSADIVTKLQQGTMLPVLARTPAGDWLLIRLGSGEEAWVSTDWVEVSVPVESLPVAPGLEATPTRPAPPPSPTPAPTLPPTPTLLPAPLLLEPPDGQVFGAAGPGVLRWQWAGSLGPEQYFVVTIAYPHNGAIWYDVHWVQETAFQPPAYLKDLITGDRRCTWQVVVMRKTGVDERGWNVGEPVSRPSAQWSFVWGQ
jgi:hypothetical protein